MSAMSQTSLARGTTVTVTITGSNFAPGAKVIGPAGVVFDGVVRVNDTTITATASTATTAELVTNKSVTVVNPAARGYGRGVIGGVSITAS